MRADKLTSKFQMALSDAQSLALGRDQQFIEPIHVMTALLDQEGGSLRHILNTSGMNTNLLRSQLGNALENLEKLPQVSGAEGEVHISKDLDRLLNLTDKYAQKRNDQYISSELFALAAIEDKGELGRLMQSCGANKQSIENAINDIRDGQNINDPNAEENRQALEKYTIDLTERAEQGKLDPVIGRDEEIRRTIQVLQRRTKNNPIFKDGPRIILY
jgi:ATP-dependent Clp protease ATP-binding subunit ClpB